MKERIGVLALIIGAMGIEGAIKCGTSIKTALVLAIIGVILTVWSICDEGKENIHDCTTKHDFESDNRPWFLH